MTSVSFRAEKTHTDMCQEVFGRASCLTTKVQQLIRSYFCLEERAILSDKRAPFHAEFIASNPFPRFVNLTDPSVLKSYLGERFKKDSSLLHASRLTALSYENVDRPIGKNREYGIVYPPYPEILAYAMQLPNMDTVLEIGGADGFHAMLLAFTHARKVILNDIEPLEISRFESLKAQLPTDVKRKLESIEGSCLDLLKIRPALAQQVDLVLCRNLIHFFSGKQLVEFFHLLKKVLKPGACAILTTMSIYSFQHKRDFFASHRHSACFTFIHCYVVDCGKEKKIGTQICEEVMACPEDVFPLPDEEFDLYQKQAGSSWQVDNGKFKTLNPEIRAKIREACSIYKKTIESIRTGHVKVWIANRRVYHEFALSELVSNYGFEVDSTFVVRDDGHLVDKDLYGSRHQIGIVFKNPNK
jgi:hypothetical protein